MIAAIDPGSDKCGLAVLDSDNQVLKQEILARSKLEEKIIAVNQKYDLQVVILGDGTVSTEIRKEIEDVGLMVKMVDESNSTLEAQKLYWRYNPPQGWRKLIPISLQSPPRAVDDYAAVILAKRYVK